MFCVPRKQTEGTVEMHEIYGRYIHVTNHHNDSAHGLGHSSDTLDMHRTKSVFLLRGLNPCLLKRQCSIIVSLCIDSSFLLLGRGGDGKERIRPMFQEIGLTLIDISTLVKLPMHQWRHHLKSFHFRII